MRGVWERLLKFGAASVGHFSSSSMTSRSEPSSSLPLTTQDISISSPPVTATATATASSYPHPQISGAVINKITNLSDEEIYHDLHASQRILLSPLEIYVKARHIGETKPHMDTLKTFFLSVLGGSFVALGAATTFYVGGTLNQASWYPDASQHNYGIYRMIVGAFGYQMGFTALCVLGADLFTSYCCYTAIAWLENRISTLDIFKVLSLVWIGNFCGSLIVAGILDGGQVFDGHDEQLQMTTNGKLALPFRVIILRALVANFLVAITALTQSAALDVSGKILAIFLPLFTFASIGFEHCIANMFILPMGCMQQASECTIHRVLYNNILPATIGNWLGGVFMAVPLAIALGHPERKFVALYQQLLELFRLQKHQSDPSKSSPEYEMTSGHDKDSNMNLHDLHSTGHRDSNHHSNGHTTKRTGFRLLSH